MSEGPVDPLGDLLDHLDTLHAAATPGEWGTYWGTRIASGVQRHPGGGVSVVHDVGEVHDEDDRADYDNSPNPTHPPADAALIVAAVNALPHLVAAIRVIAHTHRPIPVQNGGRVEGYVCSQDWAPHPCAYTRALTDKLAPLLPREDTTP